MAVSRMRDPFLRAYIEAALWSSTDNANGQGGDPLDKNYGPDDLAPETRAEMQNDAHRFERLVGEAFPNKRFDAEQLGHDFWLTRNHHGAGFWDGDWGAEGDALTKIAHKFGEYNLYVGDDNMIYGGG